MLDPGIRRLLDAYPAIFLACHRQHVREDEAGNPSANIKPAFWTIYK